MTLEALEKQEVEAPLNMILPCTFHPTFTDRPPDRILRPLASLNRPRVASGHEQL